MGLLGKLDECDRDFYASQEPSIDFYNRKTQTPRLIASNPSMDPAQDFQPRQILYLEHDRDRLYVEVVQIVATRHMCWARPLMLVTVPANFSWGTEDFSQVDQLQINDLRQAPDLLWPVSLFQAALDTEVIPLLSKLYSLHSQPDTAPLARQLLNGFIRRIWQAYPQVFQA